MYRFFTSFFVIICSTIVAQANYKVLKVRGVVKSGSAKISKGQTLETGQTIESASPISYVLLSKKGLRVAFSGKFKAELTEEVSKKKSDSPSSTISLIYGSIRAKVAPRKTKKTSFRVKTKAAVSGVRGTDFTVTHVDVLNESQIVCFEGLVDFSKPDLKKVQPIKGGQWGGVGGRFGAEIKKPLDLPQEALDFFKEQIAID